MKATFLDTSFLLATVLEGDTYHERALAWRKTLSPPFFTTEYILVEFLDAMVRVPVRPRAITTVELLKSDPDTRIVSAGEAIFGEAFRMFRSYKDKAWSITDCTSFVAMKREDIQDALTADRDFEQAGFRALLRIDPS